MKQKLAARAALSRIFPRYDIIRIAEIRLGTGLELWFGSQGLRSGVCGTRCGMSGSTDARTHALLSHFPPERCFSPLLRSFIPVFFRSDEDDDTVKDAGVGGATNPIVKETEEKNRRFSVIL